MDTLHLNELAADLCRRIAEDAVRLRISTSRADNSSDGARLFDLGIDAIGGLTAGCRLAEVCMAGLGRVALVPGDTEVWHGPAVQVQTDHPVAACLASQYAGWEISGEDYFAMGSGPMRAAAGREPLFETIGHCEEATMCVGVIESGSLPPEAICRDLAEKCGIAAEDLTLLIAPTRSLAGTVQVVARSIETALHKLHETGFDVNRIESGYGTAPLPPPAADNLASIGRTNDAILYGGQVTLFVRGDDPSLVAVGQKTPSCASPDHGRPFARIFADYGNNFYEVDPNLFSPAVVTFVNLDTGNTFRFGHTLPRVIHESFAGG